jgi:murein L,D-transpeptidase YcbB/YkuD
LQHLHRPIASILIVLGVWGAITELGLPTGNLWRAEARADLGDPKAADRLERALVRYRQLAARGGWNPLPQGFMLEPGQTSPHVVDLKERLRKTGDLKQPFFLVRIFRRDTPELFDHDTQAALRGFQERHGLEADGRLGPETLQALNVPIETRIQQLEINLRRVRSFNGDWGSKSVIWVNIPEYRLSAFENGREKLHMRVVIGTEFDPTPVFSDNMTYVVFRPEWNVPKSIAYEEILPQIQEDPEILEKRSLEVVDRSGDEPVVVDPGSVDWSEFESLGYELRQRPGPRNPLGNIKFMFPNQYNVYLHDTPADSLFKEEERAFSHGCIRVERPIELAEFVLSRDPEWTLDRIQAAMNDIESKTVSLSEPIPVHIVYWTAWVNADASIDFRDDVYKLDAENKTGFHNDHLESGAAVAAVALSPTRRLLRTTIQ